MHSSPILSKGLVGHWKFDEGEGSVARDSSGLGNDGTLNDMDESAWSDDVPPSPFAGKTSLNFDADNDHVRSRRGVAERE